MDERRRFQRIDARLPGLIKIGLFNDDTGKIRDDDREVAGLAETVDIGLGGFSAVIVSPTVAATRCFSADEAENLIGKPAKMEISSTGLVLWGDIIRVEPRAMTVAVVLTRVSDLSLWKKTCRENDDGISIFPESCQRRAQRRG